MTVYAGFDVLEEMPDSSASDSLTLKRDQDRSPNTVGRPIILDARAPRLATTFRWMFTRHSDIWAFITEWIPARWGQKVPVWVPSVNQDLALISLAGSTVTAWDNGTLALYTLRGQQRKHWAVRGYSGVLGPYAVSYSESIVSAGTAPNTVDVSFPFTGIDLGASLAARVLVMSRLYLMRLATDEVRVDWYGADLATASAQMIEVPAEEYP